MDRMVKFLVDLLYLIFGIVVVKYFFFFWKIGLVYEIKFLDIYIKGFLVNGFRFFLFSIEDYCWRRFVFNYRVVFVFIEENFV